MPIGPPPSVIGTDCYNKEVYPGDVIAFNLKFKLQQKYPDKLTQFFVYFGKKEDDMKNFQVIKIRQGIPKDEYQECHCQIVLKIPDNILDRENEFCQLVINRDMSRISGLNKCLEKEMSENSMPRFVDSDEEFLNSTTPASKRSNFGRQTNSVKAPKSLGLTPGWKTQQSFDVNLISPAPKPAMLLTPTKTLHSIFRSPSKQRLKDEELIPNFLPKRNDPNFLANIPHKNLIATCEMIVGWDDCTKDNWDQAIEEYFYHKTLFESKKAEKEKLFSLTVMRKEEDHNFFCNSTGEFYFIDDNGMSLTNYKIIETDPIKIQQMERKKSLKIDRLKRMQTSSLSKSVSKDGMMGLRILHNNELF